MGCTILHHIESSCTILHPLAPSCTILHNLAPSGTIRLNTPFEETTADGRTVTTTAVLDGHKLIKTQVGNPTTIETREFSEDGNRMTLIHTMPSEPSIRSVRGYVRT